MSKETEKTEIEELKLKLKNWGYEHESEYKDFIRAEYLRIFKLKKITKKKANILTAVLLVPISFGIYEAANMFLNLGLPSIIFK